MLHLNDAHLYILKKFTKCVEQFRARRVPHQAYNPDLAPSDFFHFEHVKSKLPGLAIGRREDLICEIWHIFEEIPKVTLISVYILQINRLKWMIKNDVDYFH
jgi:hypothetical protein